MSEHAIAGDSRAFRNAHERLKRLRWSRLGPVLAAILFSAAAWVLLHKLRSYDYHQIIHAFGALPAKNLLLGSLLAVVSYVILTGYDLLGLRFAGRVLRYRRIGMASFLSYALNNSVGLSGVVGSSLRYRLYSSWGLSSLEIAKVIGFTIVTFWIGLATVGGISFLVDPVSLPRALGFPFQNLRPFAFLLLLLPLAYLTAALVRRKEIRLGSIILPAPRPALVAGQLALATLDWIVAAAVFFVLLPPSGTPGFAQVLTVFLLAQCAGLVSNLPGGVGVFEAVVLLLLSPAIPPPLLLGSLLAYRAIYYLFPLLLAGLLLAGFELSRRREGLKRVGHLLAVTVPAILPQLLAVITFIGGAILLFSGATPAVRGRLRWLDDLLPLPVLELSHFLGSLAGIGLLLLSRGLQRRLDAAWALSILLLSGGIVLSLFKGLDYEEAAILATILFALVPCRRHFYRRASLLNEPFTAGWIGAILLVVTSSILLGLFSYKHLEYSSDVWWQFSIFANAPRFLRASVGVLVIALWFAVAKLLRPVTARPALPSDSDLNRASAIARESSSTAANLALLGDKALIFSRSGRGFLMFDVIGRTWVAMGDPVGPADDRRELAWAFREMCDRNAGSPVFYEIGRENLSLYIDLGLTFLKIGEQARIDLRHFTLEGGSRKSLRKKHRRLQAEGLELKVIPAEGVPPLLGELRPVSDQWLAEKKTREKRFSLGYFEPKYLSRFPMALVTQRGTIVAFANLWQSMDREELSVDLMRHGSNAPAGVMDFLFLELIALGQREGFRWFNLGMAPLSGLDRRRLGPLWNRIASLAFQQGENFYNFQGLRAYKEKFGPDWEPMYIATPRGLALPRVLTNVASLISGGLRGVVAR